MHWQSWKWNWTDFCPTGLTPWEANSSDVASCFQQICLQMPILVLFATFSSYQFGSLIRPVARNSTQLRLIYIRIFVGTLLAFIPIMRGFCLRSYGLKVYPADILVTCTRCVAWVVHIGYLLLLRKYGGTSHRGALFLNVIWTSIFLLDIVWFRTSLKYSYWPWSLSVVIANLIFLFSLIPSGNAVPLRARIQNQEREGLLEQQYVHFESVFEEMTLGHAQEEANFISKLCFYWVKALINKGVGGKLKKIEDLFDLPECLNISRISEKLQTTILQTKSLICGLHKTFGKEFYLIGLLRFIADISTFAGPLLLGSLLKQNTNEVSGTNIKPYLYAIGLFLSTIIAAFCGTHFNWKMAIVGMKMRIGVVTAIYRKALEARGLEEARPEILNLMSTDTDRIVNSVMSFHSFWSIPFQLFTTLYLLYTQVGAVFTAGVLFAAALIPINRWLAVKIGKISQGLMSAKDARLSVTSETIFGAKQIKLQAWEDIFIKKIQELRKTEVQFLAKRKYLDALCVYFWATTPVLMCLLTFGTSVLMGNRLAAAETYTSVALLNMLIGPLNAFPWVLNGLIEAYISIKRVQELLDLSNLDLSIYYSPIVEKISKDYLKQTVLQIKSGTFRHNTTVQQNSDDYFKLENVNLDVKKGELVCIRGPIGEGKSSLISAIVAGLDCVSGTVCLQDLDSGFGYVPQTPWLQRDTIRENILWGSVFDEQKYKNILNACALNEDIDSLGGDHVGVGENGRTLSGGQRMRIVLARAVYQDKKIYLIDDILSSLDAHVAQHVIKYCFLGLLKNKTRIIVTQSRTLLYHSHQVLSIENGKVICTNTMSSSYEVSDEENENEFEEVSNKEFPEMISHCTNDDTRSADSIMLEESREYGHLSVSVIACYWKAVGSTLAFSVLLCVMLMQVSRNLSDIWLAHWVTDMTNNNESRTTNTNISLILEADHDLPPLAYYLGIYSGLVLSNSVITLVRAFLFAYAGIKAAKFMHKKLLHSVMCTKFYFFDITSVGRILNRFSSDTYSVDDTLPFIMNILLAQAVGLVGAIFISLYAMPWLGLIIIPMCPVYINIQNRYRHVSRDIKRLSSNALSPLYTHFTETLQGLTTIRAMRGCSRFQRDFHHKLEESIKAQLTTSAAQQWLGLRLQILGALLVGGAGLLAAITSSHVTSPGLVGLAISYALSITGLLNGVLNALAETEQEMIAVERVNQYLQLEVEDNADGMDPHFGWPNQGVVKFTDVYMKYREHLSPALKHFNLKTAAFERIGIVGRTGAGKSSVLAALLRVSPVSNGEISVDCINLKTLSLRVLRDRIVIIPQEPFLFEGTIRDNLDPRRKYIDSEIWNAITSCLATPLVQSLGGLHGYLKRGGSNLSAGQKQLLCLTRALLKNSKIICIDEGTSNLDSECEAAIQIVLRNAFKSSTVLFVSHQLRGLQDFDRVIVMDSGHIVEEGVPYDLMSKSDSIFRIMLTEQKDVKSVVIDN